MNLILLGVITGAHGIKGEVKLKSFTANPSDIAAYGPLQTKAGVVLEVIRIKPAKDGFICTLRNISDRNQSEALKGTELFVDRSRLPENETYLSDLVGRTVEHNGVKLGTITGFQNFGAGELIELDGGALVPYRFVELVERDRLIVKLPEGFLDTE